MDTIDDIYCITERDANGVAVLNCDSFAESNVHA